MNSEPQIPPPSAAVRRLAARQRLRRVAPWLSWTLALGVVLWLSLTGAATGVAPGMAEIQQVTLSSPSAARVSAVSVTPGDDVVAGATLAKLSSPALEARLAEARAELERLRLEIEAQGVTLRDEAIESSERLESEIEQVALTIAQIEAEQQRDRSELGQLDEQIARQQKLVAEKLASAATLNELKLKRAALAREVAEYDRTLRQARQNRRAAEARLAAWREGKKGPADQGKSALARQLAPHRAAVTAQQERCNQLEAQVAELEVKAPFAGRVGAVLLRPGDSAALGAPLLTLVDSKPQRAIAYVDQMWAQRVRLGDHAQLRPSDGAGPRRSGRVVAVGAAITELPLRFRPMPTFPGYCREIYIALDPIAEGAPLPGQAFDVTFERKRHTKEVAMADADCRGDEG